MKKLVGFLFILIVLFDIGGILLRAKSYISITMLSNKNPELSISASELRDINLDIRQPNVLAKKISLFLPELPIEVKEANGYLLIKLDKGMIAVSPFNTPDKFISILKPNKVGVKDIINDYELFQRIATTTPETVKFGGDTTKLIEDVMVLDSKAIHVRGVQSIEQLKINAIPVIRFHENENMQVSYIFFKEFWVLIRFKGVKPEVANDAIASLRF